jgi:hypothetical protein
MGVAYFAAALVGPLMLFAVFFLSVAAGMSEVDVPGVVDGGLIWAGVGVLAIFLIVYFFADLTTWSLHPFYKRASAASSLCVGSGPRPRSIRGASCSTGLRWCPHPIPRKTTASRSSATTTGRWRSRTWQWWGVKGRSGRRC